MYLTRQLYKSCFNFEIIKYNNSEIVMNSGWYKLGTSEILFNFLWFKRYLNILLNIKLNVLFSKCKVNFWLIYVNIKIVRVFCKQVNRLPYSVTWQIEVLYQFRIRIWFLSLILTKLWYFWTENCDSVI